MGIESFESFSSRRGVKYQTKEEMDAIIAAKQERRTKYTEEITGLSVQGLKDRLADVEARLKWALSENRNASFSEFTTEKNLILRILKEKEGGEQQAAA